MFRMLYDLVIITTSVIEMYPWINNRIAKAGMKCDLLLKLKFKNVDL